MPLCFCPLCTRNGAQSSDISRSKRYRHKNLFGDLVERPFSAQFINELRLLASRPTNTESSSNPTSRPKPTTKRRLKSGAVLKVTRHQTARNLCAIDWMRKNPEGLKTDFDAYFKGLPEDQLKIWKDEEAKAKSTAKEEGSNAKITTGSTRHGTGESSLVRKQVDVAGTGSGVSGAAAMS